MTVAAPIPRKQLEDALFDWIDTATGVDVQWAKQKAPELAAPYVTLHVMSLTKRGHDEQYVDTDPADPAPSEEIEVGARGLRRMLVSVNAYALANDADDDARALMDKALAGLELESILQPLRDAGLVVTDIGTVRSLDGLVKGAWQSRCQVDVTFSVVSNVAERTTIIDEVHVASELLGSTPEDPFILPVTEV